MVNLNSNSFNTHKYFAEKKYKNEIFIPVFGKVTLHQTVIKGKLCKNKQVLKIK